MTMMMVTFAKDCAPHCAGEQRLVPAAMAAELEKAGDISAAEPWPPRDPNAPAPKPTIAQRIMQVPQRPVTPRDQRKVHGRQRGQR